MRQVLAVLRHGRLSLGREMSQTEEGSTLACVANAPADLYAGRFAGWPETGLIFAAGLLLFLVGLDGRELIQLECRTGLFVKEMLENGIGWFPTVYGRPYPDYPVTHPALIYAASGWYGRLTVQAAVLPTALAAAISLALTYRTGLFVSRPVALWAVLFELGTYGFFSTARTVALDHLTTAVTAGCFLAATSWLIAGRNRYLAAVPLLCIAGFAFRGPIGFLVPAGVAATCCVVEKRYRAFLWISVALAVIFVACGLALIAAAVQAGGRTFANQVWDMQVATRLSGSHTKTFYYYLVHAFTSYAISFPLALLVLIRLRKPLFSTWSESDARLRLLRPLGACFLLFFIGFHIPSAEAARYLLPLAPMAALIAAFLMVDASSNGLTRARVRLIKTLSLLPALGLGASAVLFGIWPYLPFDTRPSWFFLFVALLTVAGVRFKLVPRIARAGARRYLIGVLGWGVLVVIHFAVVEPIRESLEGARPFVAKLETMRGDTEPLVFFGIGPDQEDIRYVLNASRPIRPLFVRTPEELLRLPKNAWVIARESSIEALGGEAGKLANVRFEGRLGHRRCVVFRLPAPR